MIDLNHPLILMAEDDADDQLLVQEAFAECGVREQLRFVADGEELLDYLLRRGAYAGSAVAPRPGLILLDLNMPRKGGLEVLCEIKADAALKLIPTVILTTSKAEEDIVKSYGMHANCYVCKPVEFEKLAEVVRTIHEFWFSVVTLPPLPK